MATSYRFKSDHRHHITKPGALALGFVFIKTEFTEFLTSKVRQNMGIYVKGGLYRAMTGKLLRDAYVQTAFSATCNECMTQIVKLMTWAKVLESVCQSVCRIGKDKIMVVYEGALSV